MLELTNYNDEQLNPLTKGTTNKIDGEKVWHKSDLLFIKPNEYDRANEVCMTVLNSIF